MIDIGNFFGLIAVEKEKLLDVVYLWHNSLKSIYFS